LDRFSTTLKAFLSLTKIPSCHKEKSKLSSFRVIVVAGKAHKHIVHMI